MDDLVDGKYLCTGDSLWRGADGGYGFINALAGNAKEQCSFLAHLRDTLQERNLHPVICTGHTGWKDDFGFALRHTDKAWKKRQLPIDPTAPYDGYDETGGTEAKAGSHRLDRAYEANGEK